ncbi:hemolysin D [Sulfurimicrobium lacus]|uniref:Hemolysin D n=1 Tax=Sulfurimicrobium lacus TaxID=2715678 RepID=A0A6F8VBK7_9PROT|nr:HlyD family efflux transporter periplasmic adaptor subunit [Sulfurimicrobium lacus]BCB26497.1 hemolysin D [Sulfurimicrobium lacus]
MKKIVTILIVIALVAAGAMLVKKKRDQLAKEPPPQALAVVVEAARLQPGPVTLTRRTTADVAALHETVIASRLSAYVIALPLSEGSKFKRGNVLAKLDMSQSDDGQTSSLATDLAAAESSFRAEHERLERTRKLYQIQGVSLEQLQSAEASLAAVRARLALARENLRGATVTAPFDGVVSQRFAQAGDLATPGKPLLKIIDTSSGNRLLVTLPEGLPALTLRAANQELALQPWPEATPQGLRRYEARAASGFVPGTRVDARVVVFQSPQATLLPRSCLFNSDGRNATVLRLDEQNKKVESLAIALSAEGEEGAATLDTRLEKRDVVCASADILTRLAAGTPFQVRAR